MITLDFLNQQIDAAQRVIDAQRSSNVSMDCQTLRSARHTIEGARSAIRWMEEGNLTEIEQLGPWGSKNIKKGDQVKIKKGTVIFTTHPRFNRENPKIAGRDYVVEAHDVYEGYIASGWHSHKRHEAVRNQQVVWAGTGGYWCWVDSKDVELD